MGHVTAEIIERYVREVSRIYGSHLRKIILYGSYARGDFREDSDIDIMILVDLDDSEIKAAGRRLSDVTFDINFDFDVLIMPIVQNAAFLSIGSVRILSSTKSTTRGSNSMQRELNDLGGAKELALYRLKIAKEDLAAAEVVQMVEEYLNTQTTPYNS